MRAVLEWQKARSTGTCELKRASLVMLMRFASVTGSLDIVKRHIAVCLTRHPRGGTALCVKIGFF